MVNEITLRTEPGRGDRVSEANADVHIVNGRTGTYVVTVLKLGTHGKPYACFCTCKHGRVDAERQAGPAGSPIGSTTGCWHIDEAYAKSCAKWVLSHDD